MLAQLAFSCKWSATGVQQVLNLVQGVLPQMRAPSGLFERSKMCFAGFIGCRFSKESSVISPDSCRVLCSVIGFRFLLLLLLWLHQPADHASSGFASTVGLPRESKISRPLSSLILNLTQGCKPKETKQDGRNRMVVAGRW